MKIAILTHPLKENYGGILQAAALYNYLINEGHDVVVLRKHRSRTLLRLMVLRLLEYLPFQNIRNYNYLRRKRNKQKVFIDKYIPNKTKILRTTVELELIAEQERFDAVIVGSDQVWRMRSINDGHYACFFLNFVKDPSVRKISYAASFGTGKWEDPSKIDEVTFLLSKFNAVSVREKSGLDICVDLFGRHDAKLTLDPTLLIDEGFYKRMILSRPIGNDYIVTYFLDKNTEKNRLVKNLNENLNSNYAVFDTLSDKNDILSVDDWITSIYYSNFVVTDSFHGMVFAIIFKKQFIAVSNHDRGADRFSSLASILGLQDRVISLSDPIENLVSRDINYEAVDLKIRKLREISRGFLENSLI